MAASNPITKPLSALFVDPFLRAARAEGLPVFLFVTEALTEMDAVARKYPDLQFVIEHVGLPQPPRCRDRSRVRGAHPGRRRRPQ